MIRHNDEFIQTTIRIMIRQIIPAFLYDFSTIIQNDFFIFDFAKKVFAILRAGRDEICAVSRIIKILQSRCELAFADFIFHGKILANFSQWCD